MTELDAVEILKELGFSDAEAQIYLALLSSGPSLAGNVIKKTGFHRATTYQILQRLVEKGVVSSVMRNDRQVFEAVNPDHLLDLLREREQKLENVLPQLRAKMVRHRSPQEIKVYQGKKGIRMVLDDMLSELKAGETYFAFGGEGLFRTVMGPYFTAWQERKKKNKINGQVIFSESLFKQNSLVLREFVGEPRFRPSDSSLTDIWMYHDKVLILIWTGDPPIAIYIKDAENAKGFQYQFKLAWKQAKKSPTTRKN